MAILDATQAKSLEGGPSFPLSQRLGRLAWNVVWLLGCSWGPAGGPFDPWRNMWLRLFGAKIGKGARVYGGARIWWPGDLVMEPNSTIGPGAIVYSMARITIGRHAIISQRAHICAGSHDVESPVFQLIARPITIGAWSWIAAEAFVGPGVTVGEGAVLAARGAAFRSLEPWTIYRGNPAEPVKPRGRAIMRGV